MPAQKIRIDQVTVPAGRRRVDPLWVEALAELFASQGQQSPIEVVTDGDGFRLIFGLHRLEAGRLLGWPEIDAEVKSAADFASDADMTLREISENLARRELSALDKSVDIARWREVYEATHQLAKGGRRAANADSEELSAKFALSFSEAAQRAFGLSRRSVFHATKIASISLQVREALSLLPIADNQSELLALAAETHERQGWIANLLIGEPPQAAGVAEAIAIIDGLPRPAAEPRWQKVASAFSLLRTAEQRSFFELHRAAIELWLKERDA